MAALSGTATSTKLAGQLGRWLALPLYANLQTLGRKCPRLIAGAARAELCILYHLLRRDLAFAPDAVFQQPRTRISLPCSFGIAKQTPFLRSGI